MIGRGNANLPIVAHCDSDIHSRKRWKQTQSLSTQFWNRFVNEYLPTLTTRKKWCKNVRNIKFGDLVLMIDRDIPRGNWKLGRIQETFEGDGGNVRVARVKTHSGTYLRPVAKICLLEESQIE